eukprot:CAMPEP_0175821670 /NCGR_PEP_ID=MMETSP0107_2-20121207/9269_1 /TAXON_ID=195067 ORGANISM="Goniomonas pacifica, Strain CCMP1869" /NCGR_SAMPLE_ID=MMETSP0107_2 /ASSEMBLY_ACC=CAM_ASM_000203 /LENGTH=495 /DNA_ID=CAMNT_0017134085 /DNA_START=25 /DNA_END=1512 /DNA_ORIENTATION=+
MTKLTATKAELEMVQKHNLQLTGQLPQDGTVAVLTEHGQTIQALQTLISALSTEMLQLYKDKLHGNVPAQHAALAQDMFILFDTDDTGPMPPRSAMESASTLQTYVLGLPVEMVLMRWVNFHTLRAAKEYEDDLPRGMRNYISNLTSDLADSAAYLLLSLAVLPDPDPVAVSDIFAIADNTNRATKTISYLNAKYSSGDVVTAIDIAKGNNLNLVLISSLFIAFTKLDPEYRPDRAKAVRALESLEKSYAFLREQPLTGDCGAMASAVGEHAGSIVLSTATLNQYYERATKGAQCVDALRSDAHQLACVILAARTAGVKSMEEFQQFKDRIQYARVSAMPRFRVFRPRVSALFEGHTVQATTQQLLEINRFFGLHQDAVSRLYQQLETDPARGVSVNAITTWCIGHSFLKQEHITTALIDQCTKASLGAVNVKPTKGAYYKQPPGFLSASTVLDPPRFAETLLRLACLRFPDQTETIGAVRQFFHQFLGVKDVSF